MSGRAARVYRNFGFKISGRPLLSIDRRQILDMHANGARKIAIARAIGVTHSCVSKVSERQVGGRRGSKPSQSFFFFKVIRRFEETGAFDNRGSQTKGNQFIIYKLPCVMFAAYRRLAYALLSWAHFALFSRLAYVQKRSPQTIGTLFQPRAPVQARRSLTIPKFVAT